MDTDIIFLRQFEHGNLRNCFRDGPYRDLIWKTVKHLAFGMARLSKMLELCTMTAGEGPDLVAAVKELEQLSALETFTLVLDGIAWNGRRQRQLNEIVTFGDPDKLYEQVFFTKKYHDKWVPFLCKEWESEASKWNVPRTLQIKSISRGGRLQHPEWEYSHEMGLLEWLNRARRIKREFAHDDDYDSDPYGDDIRDFY